MRITVLIALFLGFGLQGQMKEVDRESKKSIKSAMEYLLKAQNKDGGFGVEKGMSSDPACSSLVGLVFLSQGSTPKTGLFHKQLTKTAEYVIRCVERDKISSGSQIEGDINKFANHYFVLLFLSQLYGQAGPTLDKKVGPCVQKLVKRVNKLYTGHGHWGTGAYADNLGAITAWLSLHSSKNAGFKHTVDSNAVRKYLRKFPNNTSWLKQLHKYSSYLRIDYSIGNMNNAFSKKVATNIITIMKSVPTIRQSGGEEYFSIFMLTECFIQQGGSNWKTWFPMIKKKIIAVQNFDGSWTGRSCIHSRIFCTACNVLTLMSPNRYLPTSDI